MSFWPEQSDFKKTRSAVITFAWEHLSSVHGLKQQQAEVFDRQHDSLTPIRCTVNSVCGRLPTSTKDNSQAAGKAAIKIAASRAPGCCRPPPPPELLPLTAAMLVVAAASFPCGGKVGGRMLTVGIWTIPITPQAKRSSCY